jgi:MFS transporter, DHA2 family, methylenomycin A resistance protein
MKTSASAGSTVLAASFGFSVVQLDVTIVNVALPRIGSALQASVPALQWVVDAYALVFGAFLLSAGALGDRLGARRTYLAGLWGFALATVACGCALNAAMLVAARAAQGVFAALLVPPSLALINHACGHDSALRARAVGTWTAAGGVSIAAGPVVGGLLVGWLGWRSVFWVNLPVCAFGILLALGVEETARKAERRLDLVGQALAVAAIAGLTGAVIEAGRLGLHDPLVLGALALGLGCAAAFIAVEVHTAQPLLPLGMFRAPDFSPSVIFGVAVNLSYYGVIFVLSFYLQHAKHYSALQAGLSFLPLTATFILSNMLSGRMAARLGPRPPMVLGAAVGALGYLLLSRLDAASPLWAILLVFAVIPAGMGLAVPAMTTAVLAGVDKASSGIAAGVLNAARQIGGAIGVAAFGALVAGGEAAIVPGLKLSAYIAAGLLALAMITAWYGIRPVRKRA